MELSITPLGKQHERKSFDCGERSLVQYLYRYASQVMAVYAVVVDALNDQAAEF